MLKVLMIIACLGHVLCGITDCMMAYTKDGRFEFTDTKDPAGMRKLFQSMTTKRLEIAMLGGIFALFMSSLGYVSLSKWMTDYSDIAGKIMMVSGLFFLILIATHHVLCGTVEWFYVRLGRTDEALAVVMEFFRRTAISAVAYVGLLCFALTFGIVVLIGKTSLPPWACVFNTFPIFLVLAPTKVPAKGNLANAVMFLGMSILL
jgi:hypothetical protein